MSVNSPVIILFFKLLNLGVLIAVGWYVYRRYVKSTIDDSMHKQESLIKGLEELGYILEGQLLELEQESSQQSKRCEQLQEKILEWKESVHAQTQRQQENDRIIIDRINERIAQKSIYISTAIQNKKIIPVAFERARAELKANFAHPEQQKKYVHSIIDRISAYDQ